MSILRELLTEIQDGRTLFAPTSASEPDMLDFQYIAKALIYAADEGYLDSLSRHRESHTGNRWYDLIRVPGGLSHKGTLFLANPDPNAEQSLMDAMKIKASFGGLSVNPKALLIKYLGKKA